MSCIRFTLAEAARSCGGTLVGAEGREGETFRGLSTDTRSLERGQAFVALVGDRFDGHDYLPRAVELGAALLVVEKEVAPPSHAPVPLLRVANTRLALGSLARAWRDAVGPTVVAITGSMGKTTTKELTRQVVATLGATQATAGNLNNDIGLPLTLCGLEQETRYLVVELGMNAPGEIAYLTGLCRPDVAVVTNVAPVHVEGLGSLEAIGREKGAIFGGLTASEGARPEWAILPAGEGLLTASVASVPRARQLRFGTATEADVRLVSTESAGVAGTRVALEVRGERLEFLLPLAGRHNALNAAAAAAVGVALGAPTEAIGRALVEAPRLHHRSVLARIGPWQVLDDCYNANPEAMKAALGTLAELAQEAPAFAVLGEMRELGDEAEAFHHEVGRHAAGCGLAGLVTVGPRAHALAEGARQAGMPAARIVEAADAEEAARVVTERLSPNGWLLVKASRGAQLERVIDALRRTVGEDVVAPS